MGLYQLLTEINGPTFRAKTHLSDVQCALALKKCLITEKVDSGAPPPREARAWAEPHS